jgi:hypothetical protein
MTDKIENLLEKILAELVTMNERSERVIQENNKHKAASEDLLNGLMGALPEQMKGIFKGGIDGR